MESADLELVTIAENTSGGMGLWGEWGLSVLIRAGDCRFLLDTGSGVSTVHNADKLGLDLDQVEAIVLSHGHADHTGGLRAVLERMRRARVRIVAHPDVWGCKYSVNRDTGQARFIGIPFRPEELEARGAAFQLTAEPLWLTDDIVSSGEEPMSTDFERVATNLAVKTGEGFQQDPLADDQSLYIRTDLGLVIVAGCAHRGVVNIARHAMALTGTDRIHMIVGGTHLVSAGDRQLESTIASFQDMGVRWLGVSHCTGQRAVARLAQAFGERFFYNSTGTVVRFPFEP